MENKPDQTKKVIHKVIHNSTKPMKTKILVRRATKAPVDEKKEQTPAKKRVKIVVKPPTKY